MLIKKIAFFRLFVAHIALGVLAKLFPVALTAYFLLFIAYAIIRVIKTSDRNMDVVKYALYVTGFEIVYRVSGFVVVYELGKYACVMLLALGLFMNKRHSGITPYFFYLLLLLPSISLVFINDGFDAYRNTVMFSLSGPITLAFSGMYFYGKRIPEKELWSICRITLLPGISLLVLLLLGPSVDSVNLIAESNFALSGGFGPNQVSTMLGFFAILLVYAGWNGQVLTHNKIMDYLFIVLFLFRLFLTFSRGGAYVFIFTILGTGFSMLVFSQEFRRHVIKYSVYAVFLLTVSSAVFFVANKLTGDWLLYRYKGISTYEVMTNHEKIDYSYFAGRERIASEELDLFKDNWLTGVGPGMSKIIRESSSDESIVFASHSEYSRLLAEHGILGVLALLILLIWTPSKRIFLQESDTSKQFFFLFFLVGNMTMLHAAMRLSLPGVITGFAFAQILSADYQNGHYGSSVIR